MVIILLLILIGWEGRESRTGPQRAGPMGGVSRVGHWESGNTSAYVRAQRAFLASIGCYRCHQAILMVNVFFIKSIGKKVIGIAPLERNVCLFIGHQTELSSGGVKFFHLILSVI